MRQFVLATGFAADLEDATAGQLSIMEAATDDSAGGNVGLNWVLKRNDADGGNILYPFYPKDFTWTKAEPTAAVQMVKKFTIANVYKNLTYTIVFTKKGKGFNERANWTFTTKAKADDSEAAIAAELVKWAKNIKTTLGLDITAQGAVVTVTGPATGEDYAISFSDDAFGLTLDASSKNGKPAFMWSKDIKDLAARCAADAGFEYTYDEFEGMYPNYPLNPLANADSSDKGFLVYTLRFTEPRVMGTREEAVYQIIQIAFPSDTDVAEFEEKLEEFVVDVR